MNNLWGQVESRRAASDVANVRLIAFSQEDVFGTHPRKLVRTCRYMQLPVQMFPASAEEDGSVQRALIIAPLPYEAFDATGPGIQMRNMFEKFRQVNGIYQYESCDPAQATPAFLVSGVNVMNKVCCTLRESDGNAKEPESPSLFERLGSLMQITAGPTSLIKVGERCGVCGGGGGGGGK